LELNMPWFSIFVPARTPKPVVTKLNAQVVRILADPETVKRLAGLGYTAQSSTPEELGEHLRKEYQRVKALLPLLNLSPDQVQ
jgi:tripartite-type tricarboxylate transporter receptor subunit TctC